MTGLVGQVALLAALAATVGLSGLGWLVGLTCAAVTRLAVARGLARHGEAGLGPADRVTLARATLVGGVAALTASPSSRPGSVAALVVLASVALVLDAVDGWLARRTGTASTFGARFDGEVDAFLILVLSAFVARSSSAWVLALGAARYAFAAAGWLLPWMRRELPYRYWRKVVTAIVGVVLTVAAADVLPEAVTVAALVVALALLSESFGRDVHWLWRRRREPRLDGAAPRPVLAREGPAHPDQVAGRRGSRRATAAAVTTLLACALVWFGLVAPNQLEGLTPGALVRLPLEAILFVGAVLLLPARPARAVAVAGGVALGLLVVLKVLDLGFSAAIGRPFDAAVDWSYLGPAQGVLADSIGSTAAVVVTAGAALAAVAVLVGTPLSVRRLTRMVGRNRGWSLRAVTALGVVWLLCAATGAQLVPGVALASTSAAGRVVDEAGQAYAGVRDQQTFARSAAVDTSPSTPGQQLLAGLRGKDVVVVFVESYGRVAVEGPAVSPHVVPVLDAGTRQLQAAGFSSRSAFLTSPTFGGISWLAHSTLQSGLWINNQKRYDDLVRTDRRTLSAAFGQAGWRTVSVMTAGRRDWPEGRSFYHYDKLYNAGNVGYDGPKFSYGRVPDQYTLAALRRLELAEPHRPPVMAEVDLVSSHTPWAPLPRIVDWDRLGDGSVFASILDQGKSPQVVWRKPSQIRSAYGQSIAYSLSAVVSFVATFHDENLVLVVLGDHQPSAIVSGDNASRDVPITVISHDPAVLDRISSWGWQDGLRPGPDAPVWRMDAFRDRFLAAYGEPAAAPHVSTSPR